MTDSSYFSDSETVSAMESEHRVLWTAFFVSCGDVLRDEIRVLDFGCNTGGMIRLLCQGDGAHGGWRGIRPELAVGIDQESAEMAGIIGREAQLVTQCPTLFSVAPAASFPGQFDVVISHEVIYLLEDLREELSGVYASLRIGGCACFATGCHSENFLFDLWRKSLASAGVATKPRSLSDYEHALRAAGFSRVERSRMTVAPSEYDRWKTTRGSTNPNPAWFPDAATEREYYTRIGKAVLKAWK